MKLIQLYHLSAHHSFHCSNFWTSSALIMSDKAARGFRESTFATQCVRTCGWERTTYTAVRYGGWQRKPEGWGLRSFLLLFHKLHHLPPLVFKAPELLLLPSPGWGVVTSRTGKWLPTHAGIAPSKGGKLVMLKIFPNYYHQMWFLTTVWLGMFPELKSEIIISAWY